MAVKVEYWLAGYLGRAQRQLYRKGRAELDRHVAACLIIGRGGRLEGRELADVQQFASAIWFRAAVMWLVIFGIVAAAASPLPRGSFRSAAFAVALVSLLLMGICLAQLISLTWRRNWAFMSANRSDAGLPVNMREERRGQPRARDFWLMFVIASAGWAFIFYASSHWNH